MSLINNVIKNNESAKESYMEHILIKCKNTIPIITNHIKINNEDVFIPNISNYTDIIKNKYNLAQLKIFAKHYKLKVVGNKNELIFRIYSYLYLSSKIIFIQKTFRGYLVKKYKELRGPAGLNRKMCTNNTDFITMEPLEEIHYHQFISYKDEDGFMYGFDLTSLYNLYKKSGVNANNPYTRTKIPLYIYNNILRIIKLCKIMNISINLNLEDDTNKISNEKAVELRALNLFQTIDSLGNYSNPQWFLSLDRQKLIKLIRELVDIWNYRAQLTVIVKRNICPPNGDPFRNLNMNYIHNETNMTNVKKVILEVLENLVNSGVDADSKTLGAYYVLCCLTLVNNDAATALPWLFQSVSYF